MLTFSFEEHQRTRSCWSVVISKDPTVILRQLPLRDVISLNVLVDRSINISAACWRDLCFSSSHQAGRELDVLASYELFDLGELRDEIMKQENFD